MSELHCDDVERLRSALSWMGCATPEGLEACCARQDDLVRDLIRAVLAKKKTIMDGKFVDCACGDRYPALSYGAGFIDATGHYPNCDASLPAAEDAQGWRPIETAPRDKTIVLLTDGKTVIAGCYHEDGDGFPWKFLDVGSHLDGWVGTNAWVDDKFGPKHWSPLPAAPAMSQDSKGEGK